MIMSKNPTIPKGTRDFSPSIVRKREYITNTIKNCFESYGFDPISTPSMENMDTLTGKYGEDGEQLIFKILNSGDYLSKVNLDGNVTSKLLTNKISNKALRYDLTVPFARYVVQHRNEINFPFRRYQIQNVWRADRPQKGRFREFTQCDADIIGTDSLMSELELIQLLDDVFSLLGMNSYCIKLNNRKILSGVAEVIGAHDYFTEITIALDKIDKIGVEKVKQELLAHGLSSKMVNELSVVLNLSGNNKEKIDQLRSFLSNSEIGLKGVDELEYLTQSTNQTPLKTATLELDISLARGLNYYTGAIFEVISNEVAIGSICGGGRYDDLTSMFGLEGISGVGISFGLDRIYHVLDELSLFPKDELNSTKVMFVNFGERESLYCLKLLRQLRQLGVKSELYPTNAKIKKQMQYAHRKNVEYVVLIGEDEIKQNTMTVKNMFDSSQKNTNFEELIKTLKY